jgi:uncharacterized damage-inducible protein DinB
MSAQVEPTGGDPVRSNQTASPFSNPASSAGDAAAAYVRSLLGLLDDRDPIAVWREQPAAIEELTRGLSDAQARIPEREGKWSIIQVVTHLADSEVVYAYRVRLTVAHDSPTIQGYDQDLWATRLHYQEESLADSLAELRAMRMRNLRFIQRLSDAELDRAGMHNERGPESVRTLVKLLAGHDLLHRAQIQRIRRAHGWTA